MDQEIIEKPMFSLGFCDILRKSFKAIAYAFENLWGRLGEPLGTFGDALEGLGGVLGDQRGILEEPKGRPKGP